jgi:hypothetical protein
MNHSNLKNADNPLLKMVKNIFNRLTKQPDEYPVKYYKKTKNFVRDRDGRLVH